MERSIRSMLAAAALILGALVAGGVPATAGTGQQDIRATGRGWVSLDAGIYHTCGVRTDGTLWCWGQNSSSQLGLGDTNDRLVPTQVGAQDRWLRVAPGVRHTCAIRTDHTMWCWGNNDWGQLGLGDTADRLLPTQVGTDVDWVSLAVGNHSCAVRIDRSLWCWGYNTFGELGLGDRTHRLVPTRVGTDLGWAHVSTGGIFTCAVRRTDRSLWCWGGNSSGQLGQGDVSGPVLIPTQVQADFEWERVTAGGNHTCGIRATDRTLWCWGHNGNGELGVGDTTGRYVPTQVRSATDWDVVRGGGGHTCGIRRTDRLMWCWGRNESGELGLGDTTDRLVPAKIGRNGEWTKVFPGARHTCGFQRHALWCWGQNDYGQLGLGDTINRLAPTRV